MKIGNHLPGFKTSAKGLSIQRKKMNLIAENIANAENTRTQTGEPYKRKFMVVSSDENQLLRNVSMDNNNLSLRTSSIEHIRTNGASFGSSNGGELNSNVEVIEDTKEGEMLYMPNHPDSNEEGYVEMSNVNVVQEMVEMISATRTYEANLTALNASKEMAKDSLEI
jgi:flagellar basal-body rod protein FlgC